MKEHYYKSIIEWTGNLGNGTSTYSSYKRDHIIVTHGKPPIYGSSDPAFRGDPSRYNPEEFLVSSLSSCHMLWYLHLCADNGVIVTEYVDCASGTMKATSNGGGNFIEVLLQPKVTVADHSMIEKAKALHAEAHKLCFIARSVNFPVKHNPTIVC